MQVSIGRRWRCWTALKPLRRKAPACITRVGRCLRIWARARHPARSSTPPPDCSSHSTTACSKTPQATGPPTLKTLPSNEAPVGALPTFIHPRRKRTNFRPCYDARDQMTFAPGQDFPEGKRAGTMVDAHMSDEASVIATDIGGGTTKLALVNRTGEIRSWQSFPTSAPSGSEFVESVATAARQLQLMAEIPVVGVSVAVA